MPTVLEPHWFGVDELCDARSIFCKPAVRVDGGGGGSVLSTGGLGINFQTGRIQTNTTLVGFSIQMRLDRVVQR